MGQGLVSKDLIRQIKERIDIADLVSGYVGLTKAGQNLKGLCPFHAEKTPSFMVNPGKQIFHCFGCGAGGDAVAFLMKRENVGFMEAVRELAQRAGMDLGRLQGRPATEQEHRRERIWKANEAAGAWFRRVLSHAQWGKPARDYLADRGIGSETAEAFGLGYALPAWDGLLRALTAEGFSQADLAAAGLIVEKEDPTGRRHDEHRYYDRFRGRLMFPIVDQRGRIMAFGGRVIGDGMPKYLNSPDLPTFKKGTALYALPQAKDAAWSAKSLIIVEGYFDAVALHQAGVRYTVATLGTALTPDHVQTLRRLVPQVVLIFDPDPAGVRAALRTLDLFKDSGIAVRVVSLPDGQDPDSFIRAQGREAFTALERQAPNLLQFAVTQSLAKAASDGLEARIRSVDEILHILLRTNNPVEREECFRLVGDRLGISQTVLLRRYTDLGDTAARAPRPATPGAPLRATGPGRVEERELVRLLLQGRLSAAHVRGLAGEYFSDPALRRIVEAALAHRESDGRVAIRRVLDELVDDAELGPVVTALSLAEVVADDMDAYIRGCLDTLTRKHREHRLSELIARLRAAEREGRHEEAHQLNAEVNALRMEKTIGAPPAV